MMRSIVTAGVVALALSGALYAASAASPGADVPIANPPATQAKTIVGDSRKPGFYIIRTFIPAGGLSTPHHHNQDRHIAILSGTLYVCNTKVVSVTISVAHKAGEYFVEPAESVHCSWARDGAVDYLEFGEGPVTTVREQP